MNLYDLKEKVITLQSIIFYVFLWKSIGQREENCDYFMKIIYSVFFSINYVFFVVIYITNKYHQSVGFIKLRHLLCTPTVQC